MRTHALLSIVLVGVFAWTSPTAIEVTGEPPNPGTGRPQYASLEKAFLRLSDICLQ